MSASPSAAHRAANASDSFNENPPAETPASRHSASVAWAAPSRYAITASASLRFSSAASSSPTSSPASAAFRKWSSASRRAPSSRSPPHMRRKASPRISQAAPHVPSAADARSSASVAAAAARSPVRSSSSPLPSRAFAVAFFAKAR